MTRPPPPELIALFEAGGAAVVACDPESGRMELLGKLAPTLLQTGEAFRDALPDDVRAEILSLATRAARDGTVATVEHRVPRHDGGERHVRTTVGRHDGQVLLLVNDLTEQRETARLWRELQSWLVTLGQSLPFDFWICDHEGRYVLQNPASQRRIGNLIGQRCDEAEWHAVSTVLVGETIREALTLPGPDGPQEVIRVLRPVREQHVDVGEVVGLLGVNLDVTELKNAERKLQASLDQLAGAQKALVRRRERDAVAEMASIVAHEVRNPLGAAANAVALLRKGQTGGMIVDSLCDILDEEIGRIDSLVSKMLDYVAPMKPHLRPAPITGLVTEALQHACGAEGTTGRIAVQFTAADKLPEVSMDGALLGMALGHLFRNALQAMPGQGRLDVSLTVEREAGEAWVRLEIVDAGSGIPEGVAERIFDPFVTSRAVGSGLGLPIAKRVVDEHKGELKLSSGPAGGTRCTVRFPGVE